MKALPVVLAFAFVAVSATAAGPREERQTYDPVDLTRHYCSVAWHDVGCFVLDGTETKVEIAVDDAWSPDVYSWYTFMDADGDFVGEGFFCSTVSADVPAEATILDVFPGVWPDRDCGVTSLATTGEIVVRFA